jgi:hypothetical protein
LGGLLRLKGRDHRAALLHVAELLQEGSAAVVLALAHVAMQPRLCPVELGGAPAWLLQSDLLKRQHGLEELPMVVLRPHAEEADGGRAKQQEHAFSHVMPYFCKTPRLAGHADGRLSLHWSQRRSRANRARDDKTNKKPRCTGGTR